MKSILIAAALLAAATPALAVNNGFETGDTSGWTGSSNTGAAGSFYGVFSPYEGDFLGFAQGGNGDGVFATLSQSFSLHAGGTISGVVGFYAGDYLPYDDDGYLAVNGVHIFDASVGSLGTYGNSGWVPFTFTASTYGVYTLELGGRNNGDNGGGPTGAVIDAVTINAGVPEAATWAMLIAGFGLTGAAMRRRKAAIAA